MQYLSDDECLTKLFQLRFGHLTTCPDCKKPTTFHRVARRRCFECQHCAFQLYPTAGTIFEKTRTDLAKWFQAVCMIAETNGRITAADLRVELDVSYKRARKMVNEIQRCTSGTDPAGEALIEVGPDSIKITDPNEFCKILSV
jgi:transposase